MPANKLRGAIRNSGLGIVLAVGAALRSSEKMKSALSAKTGPLSRRSIDLIINYRMGKAMRGKSAKGVLCPFCASKERSAKGVAQRAPRPFCAFEQRSAKGGLRPFCAFEQKTRRIDGPGLLAARLPALWPCTFSLIFRQPFFEICCLLRVTRLRGLQSDNRMEFERWRLT